jgi:hypothetical protein
MFFDSSLSVSVDVIASLIVVATLILQAVVIYRLSRKVRSLTEAARNIVLCADGAITALAGLLSQQRERARTANKRADQAQRRAARFRKKYFRRILRRQQGLPLGDVLSRLSIHPMPAQVFEFGEDGTPHEISVDDFKLRLAADFKARLADAALLRDIEADYPYAAMARHFSTTNEAGHGFEHPADAEACDTQRTPGQGNHARSGPLGFDGA